MKQKIHFRRGPGYDVRPDCEEWDGRIVEVERLFSLDDDFDIYVGEDAMRVTSPDGFPRTWIASGDLAPIC